VGAWGGRPTLRRRDEAKRAQADDPASPDDESESDDEPTLELVGLSAP
jgi:hypothetical protein